MRTSHVQYMMMIEFMERNGDLSKPSGGPRGRHFVQMKWREITGKLNSEGTGDTRTEEKWRKVWSDLKNNTKKKWAKINRAASGTGGGPALKLSLTDIENRVMHIIGVQAATGMEIGEAGFQQNEEEIAHTPLTQPAEEIEIDEEKLQIYPLPEEATVEDWNTPGSSNQPTVAVTGQDSESRAPSPVTIEELSWKPSAPKKKKKEDLSKLFVESDRNAREYARERDLVYERLETERLRLHEYEIRERVRQRDQELHLQAQWLEFLREAMSVIKRYFERE